MEMSFFFFLTLGKLTFFFFLSRTFLCDYNGIVFILIFRNENVALDWLTKKYLLLSR